MTSPMAAEQIRERARGHLLAESSSRYERVMGGGNNVAYTYDPRRDVFYRISHKPWDAQRRHPHAVAVPPSDVPNDLRWTIA